MDQFAPAQGQGALDPGRAVGRRASCRVAGRRSRAAAFGPGRPGVDRGPGALARLGVLDGADHAGAVLHGVDPCAGPRGCHGALGYDLGRAGAGFGRFAHGGTHFPGAARARLGADHSAGHQCRPRPQRDHLALPAPSGPAQSGAGAGGAGAAGRNGRPFPRRHGISLDCRRRRLHGPHGRGLCRARDLPLGNIGADGGERVCRGRPDPARRVAAGCALGRSRAAPPGADGRARTGRAGGPGHCRAVPYRTGSRPQLADQTGLRPCGVGRLAAGFAGNGFAALAPWPPGPLARCICCQRCSGLPLSCFGYRITGLPCATRKRSIGISANFTSALCRFSVARCRWVGRRPARSRPAWPARPGAGRLACRR